MLHVLSVFWYRHYIEIQREYAQGFSQRIAMEWAPAALEISVAEP